MTGGDWFRNEDWNPQIEADFRERLGRARKKSQYLRIQALHLAGRHPAVALDLLDTYFSLGEHFDAAMAHVQRARALIALDRGAEALASYEAAIAQERQRPSYRPLAGVEFATYVAEHRIERMYARALAVLDDERGPLAFPIVRYRAHGARALFLHHFGREAEARESAELALAAAAETRSGFSYHQDLGLVTGIDDDFGRRIAALAQ